jgi:hypothetical protein
LREVNLVGTYLIGVGVGYRLSEGKLVGGEGSKVSAIS